MVSTGDVGCVEHELDGVVKLTLSGVLVVSEIGRSKSGKKFKKSTQFGGAGEQLFSSVLGLAVRENCGEIN